MNNDFAASFEPNFSQPSLDEIDGSDVTQIDIRKLWSAAYRNRFLIGAIIGVCLVLAFVLTTLTRPIYQAEASVQIEQQSAKVLESQDVEPVDQVSDADRFLQTQVDILTSRELAIKVMDGLGLARDDSFLKKMHIKATTTTIGVLGLAASKREQIIHVLMNNFSVDLPRNSRIALIHFKSPDPGLAAQIANRFAQEFITSNLQRRYDTTSYARNFLQQQLSDARQRLQESERAAIAYARAANLIDASNGAGSSQAGTDNGQNGPRSLTIAGLVQLSTALNEAQATRIAAQQRWDQAQKVPLLNLTEVLANPAIQQLMQQRAQLVASYQEERQRRKADYPTMIQAAAEINELNDQINKLALSVKSTIQDAYKTALDQEQALGSDVAKLRGQVLNEQDRSVRYNILRRDVDTNRELYEGLLQRYRQVSSEAGITTNNISVIDTADPPVSPVSPKPLLNIAVALLFGVALSVAVVWAREKFDDAIRSPDDVPAKLGQPLLAAIPLLGANENPMEMLEDPRSAISEAYHALRATLELSTPSGLPGALLFTSSRPSEGKSTTTYAIARDFAKIGKRVVLVDADLRKPVLHRMLGLSNQHGLTSLIVKQRSTREVVQQTGVPALDFIACGPIAPNPAELLAGPPLQELLDELRELYDLVVIDGPPMMGIADAAQLSSVVGGTVLIVEANGGHHGSVKAAMRRLMASRAHLLGVVLTKFDAKKSGYGYGYGYGYAYSYSYGENEQQ